MMNPLPPASAQEFPRSTPLAGFANNLSADSSQSGTGTAASSPRPLPAARRTETAGSFLASDLLPAPNSPKPSSNIRAAPERSADRSPRKHHYPWARRELATPRELQHSGWHIPRSYQVSSWLRSSTAGHPAAAWIRQHDSIVHSALRHQSKMARQHPGDPRRNDKPEPRHQHDRADYEQRCGGIGNTVAQEDEPESQQSHHHSDLQRRQYSRNWTRHRLLAVESNRDRRTFQEPLPRIRAHICQHFLRGTKTLD